MSYGEMAYVYDELMQDAPYDLWLEFTRQLLEKNSESVKTIADLGSGTGEMTIRLAEAGFKMYGIDYSEEMLMTAVQKAGDARVEVQWLMQDLRTLEGLSNLDAAVSYFDVINYITNEDDLRKVFKNICMSLRDGGFFLFDIHSMHHVANHYIGQTFATVSDDVSYIWFCSKGEELGEMFHDLTFFVRDEELYERFDEYHHQRTYPIQTYESLLKEAGFKNVKWYSDPSLEAEFLDENAPRIFFLAEK